MPAVYYTYNGHQYTAKEASKLDECVVGYDSLMWRLKAGWSLADAMTIPPNNTPFTPEDDIVIYELMDGKITRKEAMQRLGRSDHSVGSRAKKLRAKEAALENSCYLTDGQKLCLYHMRPNLVDGGRWLWPR